MTIPATILTTVKDLLRRADTTYDSQISASYDSILTDLCLEHDLFAEQEYLAAVKGQHLYTVTTRFARILAVLWNHLALQRTSSQPMDRLSTWQTDPAGNPEFFVLEKLPPEGTVTPQQFSVVPAPSVSASGEAGLVVFEIAVPTSLVMQYMDAYLAYRTAQDFLATETPIRDLPASQFWGQVAETFLQAVIL